MFKILKIRAMKKILRIFALALTVMLGLNACDVEKEPYIQGAEDERSILEFRVDSVYGTVDEDTKIVRLDFPAGTDVTHLTPTIIISNYATIEPASGVAQDQAHGDRRGHRRGSRGERAP